MKFRDALLGSAGMFAAIACVPSKATPAGAAVEASENVAQVLVSTQAHVCVRVTVDQSVWPHPVDAETVRNMSGVLMAELRSIYQSRGGSDRMPGTNNGQRFHTNHIARHPFCQNDGTNVFVSAHYADLSNGKPFTVRYSVQRGLKTLTRSASVDVEAEMRAGRIRPYTIERKADAVIADDLLARAPELASHMRF